MACWRRQFFIRGDSFLLGEVAVFLWGIINLSLFLVKSSLNEITTICNSLNKNIHFITILI